jgi:tRNA wybutosine-synthesizing protein 2
MTAEIIPGQPHAEEQHDGAMVLLKVPRAYVKDVKLVLESNKLFDRYHGISPEPEDEPTKGPRMCVPTLIPYEQLEDGSHVSITAANMKILLDLNLDHFTSDITYGAWNPSEPTTRKPALRSQNILRKALTEAFSDKELHAEAIEALGIASVDTLIDSFPGSYSIYKPLLLFPSTSFNSDWTKLISHHPEILMPLWQSIAAAVDCTHIALNSPIPPSNAHSSTHSCDEDNILRSPVNLTRLYGDFGPAPTAQSLAAPGQKDLEDALWVSTIQNGIRQTWAPLYTMFSRGNVKEKARILELASASLASSASVASVEDGRRRRAGSGTPGAVAASTATAVDMYAGIGYFSFSYRRAGFACVICFELNPWSVEGLRRGAALNGWSTRVFTAEHVPARDAPGSEWEAWRDGADGAKGVVGGGEDFLIFAMSNEYAAAVLRCLTVYVPPIRHVNLGLLPVSRLSWPSAVRAVDLKRGGWIHAHENVGVVEMDERRTEIEAEFQRLVDERDLEGQTKAKVEHVEKVKMYAPGVVHAVFDVYIPGLQSET